MKKKTLILLSIICLFFIFSSCGKKTSKFMGSYAGTWEDNFGLSSTWTGSVDKDGNFSIYVQTSSGSIEGSGTVSKFGAIDGIFKKGGSISGVIENGDVEGHFFNFLSYSTRAFKGKKL